MFCGTLKSVLRVNTQVWLTLNTAKSSGFTSFASDLYAIAGEDSKHEGRVQVEGELT